MSAVIPRTRRRSSRSPLRALGNMVEALATPHALDRYLELINPMLTVRELRAEVTEVHRSTTDSVTLTLRPTRQWKGFRAGQFVQVTIEVDGVRRTRCYSPSCSQYRTDGRIEITVKAHPEGVVSQWLHTNARRGLVVGLSQADGTFTMPDERPDRIVLVSGGSGITPVLSMLRTLCDEDYRGDVVFLHYAFTAADVAHRAELEALAAAHDNVRLVTAYTEADDGELAGYFSQEHLDAAAPWHAEADTYLCGPAGLMRSVREQYKRTGLADRLHVEEFAPAPLAAVAGEPTGTVSFARSGASTDNSGATLLEQAEAAGLTPEYGCRMGICFSCTQIKTSGCTRNVRTGETNSDPDTEIQLCINAPVGDVAIEI